jgi:hypothetical protein
MCGRMNLQRHLTLIVLLALVLATGACGTRAATLTPATERPTGTSLGEPTTLPTATPPAILLSPSTAPPTATPPLIQTTAVDTATATSPFIAPTPTATFIPRTPTPTPRVGAISGSIESCTSSCVPLAHVIVVAYPGGQSAPVTATSAGDGSYRLAGVPAGPVTVVARCGEATRSREVTVAAGKTIVVDFTGPKSFQVKSC